MRYGAIFSLALFFGATLAHAQSLGAEPLTISLSPAYPAPYQTIAITPSSTVLDLGASTITVSVNGTVISKGSGGAATNYTVGGAGETDKITITAVSGGQTYTQTATVRPQSVALIEEPLSTTHPFYGGGALIAPEGRVRLVAVANFYSSPSASVPANSLVYTWKAGDQILQSSSGIGKSSLTVIAPVRYRDIGVSVTVSTPDGSLVGQASTVVSPVDPLLLIYKNGPLLGPQFDEVAENPYEMSGEEDSFRAVPYFFAAAPSISWSVNGTANGTEPVVTVRTTGSSAGTAVLSATANQSGTYQSASDSRTIHYGASSRGTNIFGL